MTSELAPHFMERWKRIFSAEAISQDGQLFSSGEAILETDQPVGVFWPLGPWPEGKNPAIVTGLKRPTGEVIPVKNFHQCNRAFGSHFHFEV